MTPPRPTLLFAANSCWNLAHFRAPLLRAFGTEGYHLVAAVPEGDDPAALEAMGVEVWPVRLDRAGTSPLRDLRLLNDYRSIIRTLRPAAFLGFTAKPNVYGGLAARWCGVPSLLNISGLGTAFLSGRWLERVMTALYRASLGGACTVFFQNDDDRDLFVERRLVRPGQVRMLAGSGVDLERFAQVPLPAGRGVRFLLIARMLRDKGVIEFVEAARQLRDGQHAFLLVGPAGDDNRSAIAEAELLDWNREGAVQWLGPSDDVRGAIANADVVVLPSYREGMPRTLIEAAAMGRPVIATDVPGCRQAVVVGETGLLCEVRNADSLAGAMKALIEAGPERLQHMGDANRRRAETEFGQARIVDIYREALAACGAAVAG